jgi:trehalose 6-phosphate synthase/phosphatase
VNYRFRSLDHDDLLAHYRACQIALVTPLKDGMNLVAKEYCACCVGRNDGALILSKFAGAAEQLKSGSLLVNPYDVEQVAEMLLKVFRMSDSERSARMKRLRRIVRKENVFWWVDSFLRAGAQVAARSTRVAKR